MELEYSELDDNIRRIKLKGKLDIVGAGQIETRFGDYSGGEKVRVIVDLSEVDYLASIGIRLLTLTAKSVANRGGKMVLLNPTPDVYHVLDVTGIPSVIPVYSQLEAALTDLLAF